MIFYVTDRSFIVFFILFFRAFDSRDRERCLNSFLVELVLDSQNWNSVVFLFIVRNTRLSQRSTRLPLNLCYRMLDLSLVVASLCGIQGTTSVNG